jgi:hypothetical protein
VTEAFKAKERANVRLTTQHLAIRGNVVHVRAVRRAFRSSRSECAEPRRYRPTIGALASHRPQQRNPSEVMREPLATLRIRRETGDGRKHPHVEVRPRRRSASRSAHDAPPSTGASASRSQAVTPMPIAPMTAKIFCHGSEDIVSAARPCAAERPASAAGPANSSATARRTSGERTSAKMICAAVRVAPPARRASVTAPSGLAPL